MTDGDGTPLLARMTPANTPDGSQVTMLLDAIPPVRGCVGPPRRRPKALCADKAYDWRSIRRALRSRGIEPEIPRRNDVLEDDYLGIFRWVVERTIAWYRQFRRLKVRYERRADMHQAFLDLATCTITYRRFQGLFC